MTSLKPLPARALAANRDVERHLARGDAVAAERALPIALLLAPDHAPTLHLAARVYRARGRVGEALEIQQEAVTRAPWDVDLLASLGALQLESGQFDRAIATLRTVTERRPGAASWLELGIALDHVARHVEALAAADTALALDPGHARARLLRARSLQATGDIVAAATEYRELIARGQHVAAAWFALVDIKTVALEDAEVDQLVRFAASTARTAPERELLDFALARVHEGAGRPEQAIALLDRANASVRLRQPWNAGAHHAFIERVVAAFQSAVPVAGDETRGSEVIFIVGLPRSGSTLIEQILASHPRIEGASELSDLPMIISTESARRRLPFPEWVESATPADWERLGRDYLARTEQWRRQRPMFTDKAPENWRYAGAIARMLPGARIVDCRRDAVETCWSCFKQMFAPGCVGFTYSISDLADYWHDYVDASAHWHRLMPARYRTFLYEDLVADPASTTRALLEFCGVTFHEDCLQPHRAQRAIRTSSSAQVRQPIAGGTARSADYGALLDPLRTRLGFAPWGTRIVQK